MSISPFAWSRMKFALAGCGYAAWLALAGCEGSATQTTTGKGIEGILVDSHGDPVSGATVQAWPAASGPVRGGSAQNDANALSARTDEHGHYAIADLEVGIYNVFGADPSNHAAVLIPRVKYLERAADLGIDTLKAPGTIIGQVRVEGGKPPLTFCFLEGSNYAAISDSTGRFVLPALAEGAYRLNYFADGYLRVSDSVVTVHSGDTTVLAARTLAPDLALQPPAPRSLTATYDSVYGVVHLVWGSVNVADFKEYVIEHRDSRDMLYMAATRSAAISSFDDYMMVYFGIYGVHSEPFVRTYWIRSKDVEGNLSPKSADSVSVLITDPSIFKTSFSMHAIVDSAAPASCQDTLGLALDVVSSPDSLVRIQWRAKAYYRYVIDGETLEGDTPSDSVGESIGAPGRDTLYFTPDFLQNLETADTRTGFDSVLVSAQLANQGGLIRSVTVPVGVDSLGCLHPSAARENSNGKVPW
jgi:hypothetical protein